MISFYFESDFKLNSEVEISNWVSSVISSEGYEEGDIDYIFCNDEYLLKLNVEFLKHDTLTDIISFDYSLGKQINGEIYISVERVMDNAAEFNVKFEEELQRVIVHGVLHYCGYKDKSIKDAKTMRDKENHYIAILHNI